MAALRGAALAYGDRVLFHDADLAIYSDDRVCLVGRNGSGKSTLIRILAGDVEIDAGERFVQPGVRIGHLPQNPVVPLQVSVRDHVMAAVPADVSGPGRESQVDDILANLALAGDRVVETLSGGEFRRVAIARLLAGQPDVMLLDEPTNHLDLPTIAWLESWLHRFTGALLLVSHDRAFLRSLSARTYWIDRAVVHRSASGFSGFAEWSEAVLAAEETRNRKRDKRIVEELRWLREGLTARRKRNMGRVRALADLRSRKRGQLQRQGSVRFTLEEGERSGQLVIEAQDVSKRHKTEDGRDLVIVNRFSMIVRRRDRIGFIGRNGAGKTSLLRLLIGRDKPDSGRVRVGHGVETVYFDQRRESLDLDRTPWSVLCPGGGDMVEVAGRSRHVVSYLRDFLFEERQATSPVRTLSGGERNRLLLARLFAQRHNLVVLDEPTNDLDVETLELLEDVLADYDGTILMVSHDRDFLDRVVTSTVALEGDGVVSEYPGGYSDYLVQRPDPMPAAATGRVAKKTKTVSRNGMPADKLGHMEQRELDQLPSRIAALEAEISEVQDALSDPDLYRRDPRSFASKADHLATARTALEEAEARWIQLEDRRTALAAGRFG